jgi:hypothetical protein
MKLKFTLGFQEKLEKQIEFIAKDKSIASRKFKNDLLTRIKEIPVMPYKKPKIYFL